MRSRIQVKGRRRAIAAIAALGAAGALSACGGQATSMGVGDFNQDGRPDVAVGLKGDSWSSPGVALLLNRNGALSGLKTLPLQDPATAVAVGNFGSSSVPLVGEYSTATTVARNKKVAANTQDVAAISRRTGILSVMLNEGADDYSSPIETYVGEKPVAMATGSFNGDGRVDLAIANREPSNLEELSAEAASDAGAVTIALGNGDGTFDTQEIPVSYRPREIAVGDVNNDRNLDVAYTNRRGNVEILYGKGNGDFTYGPELYMGPRATALVLADLNGDNKADLASTSTQNEVSRVTIRLSQRKGGNAAGLGDMQAYEIPYGPTALAAGNLAGDARPDLVVATAGDGTGEGNVSMLVAKGATMEPAIPLSLPVSTRSAINLGKKPPVQVQAPVRVFGAGQDPVAIGVDDFNADGRNDVAVVNRLTSGDDNDQVTVLRGNGLGKLTLDDSYDLPGDVDLDWELYCYLLGWCD